MVVLIGGGSLARRLVDSIADRRRVTWVYGTDGSEGVGVEDHVEMIRQTGDPRPVADLLDSLGSSGPVIILRRRLLSDEDPREAIQERWPDRPVLMVAEADEDADHETVRVADLLHDSLMSRLDRLERSDSARALLGVIERLPDEAEVAIFAHDNPDPDALASAVALSEVIERTGRRASIWHGGRIEHQSNVAMVRELGFSVNRISRPEQVEDVLRRTDGFVMVDMHRVGANNMLPDGNVPLVIIDHHPPTGDLPPADLRILRPEFGATSSLVTHLLMDLNMHPDEAVATGLVYGIRSDTLRFTRGFKAADLRALSWLNGYADADLLQRIETPPRSADTLDAFSEALSNLVEQDGLLLTGLHSLPNRDALPQVADFLLDTEGVGAVVVFGPRDGRVHLSARSRREDVHLGRRLAARFPPGMAGGHRTVAGGQVSYAELLGHDEVDVEGQGVVRSVIDAMYERLAGLLDEESALPDSVPSGA